MLDLLLHLGGLAALAILLVGAALALFLFCKFIGEEASVFVGVLLAAYPAFLAYRKFG